MPYLLLLQYIYELAISLSFQENLCGKSVEVSGVTWYFSGTQKKETP